MKSYLFLKTIFRQKLWHYIFSRGRELNSMLIWLFRVCSISMTKSVSDVFTVTIHIYIIKINSIMILNISFVCLILDIVRSVTHHAVQTNYHTISICPYRLMCYRIDISIQCLSDRNNDCWYFKKEIKTFYFQFRYL